jgi:hypothetical protein
MAVLDGGCWRNISMEMQFPEDVANGVKMAQ